jgi:hypothetical protein
MNLNRFSTNIKHFSYKFALRPFPIEWAEENKFSIYHPLDRVNINIINKNDLDSKIKLLLEAPSNFEYHQNVAKRFSSSLMRPKFSVKLSNYRVRG